MIALIEVINESAVDIMAANIADKNNTEIKGGKVVDIIWGKTWTDDMFGNKLPPIAPIIPIGKQEIIV